MKFCRMPSHLSLVPALLVFLAAGPPVCAAQNAVLRWNDVILKTIRATSTPPPLASRALAMAHTAMFDAWAAYDANANGTRLGGRLRQSEPLRTQENKVQAISFAAYRVLLDLYPMQKQEFDELMRSLGFDPAFQDANFVNPSGIGNTAAAAVLEFRHADGSNQLGNLGGGPYSDYTNYRPVNSPDSVTDIGHWQPLTLPNKKVQTFLVPHWGRVIPFALLTGSQFRPGPPPGADTSLFGERVNEIRQLSAQLDDRTQMIAEFWEDGAGTETPPGHWNRFAHEISIRDSHTLDEDVRMFFVLTGAAFDGGIAAWDSKVVYDCVRPVTAIRSLFRGQRILGWAGPGKGVATISGEDWQPYLTITPPFSEYVSGHSTFSAASAEVLMRFTGSDKFVKKIVFEPGSSRMDPKVSPRVATTLHWASFSEAADQAGFSRRVGGIHFEEGDMRGRTLGRIVGVTAWQKYQEYLGTSGSLVSSVRPEQQR
ncbi:MAG: phosphoesterase [Bryobacteraceae bacterium]|nr:phosphoesterase [Bryobacteraceae bacterium]